MQANPDIVQRTSIPSRGNSNIPKDFIFPTLEFPASTDKPVVWKMWNNFCLLFYWFYLQQLRIC